MTTETTLSAQIVFIDGGLTDLESLLAGIAPGMEVVILDPLQDGLAQIVAALEGRSGLSAIHIISHGGIGSLDVGATQLTQSNMTEYESQLEAIGSALSDEGDLLLYGCDVAQGESGQSFIESLAAVTGADVAASTDLTGASFLGGDWVLEASTGSIETAGFSAPSYDYVLESPDVGQTTAAFSSALTFSNTVSGTVGFSGDQDWYRIALTAGVTYAFYEAKVPGGTLDSYLRLYNSAGASVAVNDDSGGYLNSLLLFTPAAGAGGFYFVSAGGYSSNTGDYALVALNVVASGTAGNDVLNGGGSNDYLAGGDGNDTLNGSSGNNFLQGGFGNDSLTTFSGSDTLDGGYGADTLYGGDGSDVYYVDDINDVVTEYYNDSLGGTADTVLTSVNYALSFGMENLFSTGGWLTLTGNANNNRIVGDYGNNLIDGGAGVDTLEGGTGDDTYVVDNSSDSVIEAVGGGTDTVNSSVGYSLPVEVENLVLTGSADNYGYGNASANVITGNDGNNYLWSSSANDTLLGGAGNDTLDGSSGIDSMAGGSGNDVYYVDTVGDIVVEMAGEGSDTVYSYLSTYTLAAEVETLNVASTSTIGVWSGTGNILDNLVQGYTDATWAVANSLSGDAGNDTLYGYGGNDTLEGGAGDDVLYGGEGNDQLNDYWATSDTLDGGAGADNMNAGDGNDVYYVDNAGDVAAESYDDSLGGTTDTVYASVTHSLGYGIENLILTGSAAINGTGTYANNAITGNSAANVLDGGAGIDTLTGGDGDDTYVVDSDSDIVVENSGEGTDTVQSSATTYTLAANVENLTLTGSADINGVGNAQANNLTGNTGDNVFTGGGGNDTITGGIGIDTAVYSGNLSAYTITIGTGGAPTTVSGGGDGTDNLIGIEKLQFADQVYDLIINQTISGGSGADSLPGGLGNDTISGFAGNDTLEGDAGRDSLDGGSENDLISGGSGDDTLVGGTGNDTMSGGAGNDFYYVDGVGDVVTEIANEGTSDWVYSTINYTLPTEVENGYIGIGAFSNQLTGNSLNNQLYGSSRADVITGLGGNDYLYGYQDLLIDTLVGGTGDDTYELFENENVVENTNEGTDTIRSSITYALGSNFENLILTGSSIVNGTGNAANNAITGNSNNNTLNGLAGADTLSGGGGNDTYVVDDIGDVVVENTAQGTDLVQSSVSHTLSANVENLTLTGVSAINGTGNTLNNLLTGNSVANVLDGGGGSDTLVGGLGDDTYVIDVSTDVVTELANEGADRVQSTLASYVLAANVEHLTLLGIGNIAGTGNALDNVITGNTGANLLDGVAGDDRLIGGAGNDTLTGGTGNDTLDGGAGTDTITTLGNAADYSFVLASNGVLNLQDINLANGNEGSDLLAGVEVVQFADRAYMVTRTGGVGNDISVSTMAPGYDTTPNIALLAGGGSVVSWEEAGNIYTQRYDAYGQTAGGKTLIAPNYSNYGDIAALTDGGYAISYYGWDSVSSQYRILVKRFDASGSNPVSLVVSQTTDAWDSSITALSNGGFAVSWAWYNQTDPNQVSYDIKARVYGANNAPAGNEFTAFGGSNWQYTPGVSALTNGGFVVSAYDNGAVMTQRYDNAGVAVGSALRADPVSNYGYSPSVAGLSDGGFLAVWQSWDNDSDGIFAQRIDSAGAKVGAVIQVNSYITSDQGYASAAGLAGGGFVVAWESNGQDGSGYGIYARRFSADGTAVGNEFLVNSVTANNQSRASVAADADGGFVITWKSNAPGANGIYLQRFDAGGAAVGGLTLEGSSLGDAISMASAPRAVEIHGMLGNDSLTGGSSADVLDGGVGNDLLDGGAGADSLVGGLGDDIFIVDNLSDIPYEASGEGHDRVQVTIDGYALPEQAIEELQLLGSLTSGTGNSYDNTLLGNDFDNLLTGVGGNDTVMGGRGTDTAHFSGELAEYVFGVRADGQITVRHNVGSGGDGTDVLLGVEQAQFEDRTVSVASNESSGLQFRVNVAEPGDSGYGYQSRAATLPDGNRLVIWHGSENGAYGLHSLIQDLTGHALGQPQLVSTANYPNFLGLAAYNNGAVAGYAEWDSGASVYRVKAQLLDSGGASNGLPLELGTVSNTDYLYTFAVNSTADGGFTIAWLNYSQISADYLVRAQHFDASGAISGGQASWHQNESSDFAILPDGSFISFGDQFISSSWHLTGQLRNSAGSTVGGEIDLGGPDGSNVSVITLDNGNRVVGYQSWNGTDYDQWLGVYNSNWTVIRSPAIVHAETGQAQSNLDIAALPGGRFVAVWWSDITTQGDIYARLFDSTGNPVDVEFVVNPGTAGNQNSPHVVANADGSFTVYWQDNNTSVIYQTLFDADGRQFGGLKLSGTDSAEVIVASDALQAVHILGMAGNDSLVGGAVSDKLEGGTGNDTLYGGTDDSELGNGIDTLIGGAGNDTYIHDGSNDVFVEYDGQGLDTVLSLVNYVLPETSIENLQLDRGEGATATNAVGNSRGNVLTGNALANFLDGGAGADSMEGGAGDDIYVVDNILDVVTEQANGGLDTVQSSVTLTLLGNIENLILTGAAVINGTGNALNNLLDGKSNSSANVLTGLAGNDLYVVGAGDSVVEASDGGTDTVRSEATYSLAGLPNVENVELLGSGNFNATGNAVSNQILGNSGGNVLDGGSGDDTLDGGSGIDTLIGGAGNDQLQVDNAGDVVTEYAAGGTDVVLASVTYVLPTGTAGQVENLTLMGTDSINGTGNDLANIVTGNAGNNVLDGGLGNDTLIGGEGDDTYVVDGSAEIVTEQAGQGSDTLKTTGSMSASLASNVENVILLGGALVAYGNSLDNALTGTAGNNTLDGGAGADTMTGGAGDDTYQVDSYADVINEAANEGKDRIVTDLGHYELPVNVEELELNGTTTVRVKGNTLNNYILGNAISNDIDGLAGNDTMAGDKGDDFYTVDSLLDVVVEKFGEGSDTVFTNVSGYTLPNNVENLALNASALSGKGNFLSNILTGNDGNNTLDGGAGIDTMIGGPGDDVYKVDNANDMIVEQPGEGTDRVDSTISFDLAANVENLTLENIDNVTLLGNGNNAATGNDLPNVLIGNTGNNLLDGGLGDDTMQGGLGNDTYIVEQAGDVVTELAGQGTDLVRTTLTSYTLGDNFENLTLEAGAVTGTGNLENNYITGNDANNTLVGGAGDDTLDGGKGADSLIGGAGDDDYYIDNAGDRISENPGEGRDAVYVDFRDGAAWNNNYSFTLAANVEDAFFNFVPLSFLTEIIGNTLANLLQGNDGANRLNGGVGADTMEGGKGDDIYVVGEAGDVVTEAGGEGTDTVETSIDYVLGNNLENLVLGTGANAGTGNGLANQLVGNGGNNLLDGGAGNDSMAGGAGNDTYKVDNTNDVVQENGGEGYDTVLAISSFVLGLNLEQLNLLGIENINGVGNGSNNLIIGNTGSNVIDGGGGLDTISYDTAIAGVTANLGNGQASGGGGNDILINVEGLQGSNYNDSLVGAVGDNTLIGGAGRDTMAGGTGNDVYFVDDINDVIVETDNTPAPGGSFDLGQYAGVSDTVNATVSYNLGSFIENLQQLGTANINSIGNELDNQMAGNSGNNLLQGMGGNDTLSGGAGNDTLDGGAGIDSVDFAGAVAGISILAGVVLNDGQGGTDTLISIENIIGGGFNDTLTGGSSADYLNGGAGNDQVYGDAGNDTLIGGVGDDRLGGGAGNDSIDGGTGTDTADYTGAAAGISAVLFSGVVANDGQGGADTLLNIENIIGSGFNDSINGSAVANRLDGGAGNDLIFAGAGDDTLIGGEGNDTLGGAAGNDSIDGGNGIDTADYTSALVGISLALFSGVVSNDGQGGSDTILNIENLNAGAFNDTINGSAAVNRLDGGAGNDLIFAGAGDDTLVGGEGNDTLGGGGGNDSIDGGNGIDTADYTGAGVGISLALFSGVVSNDGQGGSDTILNIENLNAGAFNDTINGSAAANRLDGGAGNDIIFGGAGDDTLVGGEGNDTLGGGGGNDSIDGGNGIDTADYTSALVGISLALFSGVVSNDGQGGSDTILNIENLNAGAFNDTINGSAAANRLDGGAGNDLIFAGAGDDTLVGGEGNDTLGGGGGNDSIDGGNGIDTADYTGAGVGISVALFSGVVSNDGQGGTDSLISIENVNGSGFNDTISGSSVANRLDGGAGNDLIFAGASDDTLIGGAGNDTLGGGTGNDQLTGGAGTDFFVFDAALGAGNVDTITDFSVVDDTIQLENAVFTILTVTGTLAANQFRSGAGVTTAADGDDYLIYNTTTGALYYDADGNGGTAPVQFASLSANPALTAGDFLVI